MLNQVEDIVVRRMSQRPLRQIDCLRPDADKATCSPAVPGYSGYEACKRGEADLESDPSPAL